MILKLLPNQRVFVTGKTRSGKSYLVLHALVPLFRYYVIYDYKNEIDLPGAVIFRKISDFRDNPGQPKIIYRPDTGTDDEFNQLCGVVFRRGNTMFVVDEIVNHCTQHNIQPNHAKILRLGASLGIGIINCTQEPVGVHRNLLTQAEHFFIFDIPDPNHRKKLAGYTGPQVVERVMDYHFWYYSPGMRDPVLMSPVSA